MVTKWAAITKVSIFDYKIKNINARSMPFSVFELVGSIFQLVILLFGPRHIMFNTENSIALSLIVLIFCQE